MALNTTDTSTEVNLALSVIDKGEKLLTHMKSIADTVNHALPVDDEPIDKLGKLGELAEHVLSESSVLAMKISVLCNALNKRFIEFGNKHKKLLEDIRSRDQSRIQPNTNVTHYDEDHLITDFITNKDLYGLTSIPVQMKQIVDPDKYSNLALVHKIEHEEDVLLDIKNYIINIMIFMGKKVIPEITHAVNIDIEFLASADAIHLIESNPHLDNTQLHCLKYTGSIITFISEVKKSIQILNELAHNYSVYEEVVRSYTSITLESVYSPSTIITY